MVGLFEVVRRADLLHDFESVTGADHFQIAFECFDSRYDGFKLMSVMEYEARE
jgi:hypothetical protein